jgi:peptidyl-prolyl cis-trans isomerase SurA
LIATSLAGLAIAAVSQQTALAEEMIDGIAAQVGRNVVLYSEVLAKVSDMEARLVEAGAPQSEIHKLRADGLERMIEEKILEGEVERLELRASDAEIDQVIEVLASDNGITIDQLHDTVRSQGMTMEDYRAEIRGKVEQRKVMNQALQAKIVIEEEEVRRAFDERFANQPQGGDQVHIRQLLVPVQAGRSIDVVCAAADQAMARIRGGETFEAVASEFSAVSPKNGGDIGWLHADSLASWMAKLLAPLDPGEHTEVSRQPFGCNILKLVERRAYEPVTYEQARPLLEQDIYAKKAEVEFTEWMEDLRKHTYIKRRGYFAEAANFDDIGGQREADPLERESLFQ